MKFLIEIKTVNVSLKLNPGCQKKNQWWWLDSGILNFFLVLLFICTLPDI